MHKNLRPMNLSMYYGGLEGQSTFFFIRDFLFSSAIFFFSTATFLFPSATFFFFFHPRPFFSSATFFSSAPFFFIHDFFFHPRPFFFISDSFFIRTFFYPRLLFLPRVLRLRAHVHWSRPEIAIAIVGEDGRFHGRRRHLGCGPTWQNL